MNDDFFSPPRPRKETLQPFNVKALLQENEGRNYELHRDHINPTFARVLKIIGFDRCYTRAEGPYLWDDQGRKYLDMLAGYGVFNIGRNHPYVRDALIDFMHADYASLVQMEAPLLSGLLAEELKKRVQNELDIVYFTNSGAEGIETAIKFARRATGRATILYADKAFHGLTNGSLSLNGDEIFRDGFGPLLPDCRRIPFNDLAALDAGLDIDDVAAFVVEPIQGKGVNIPSDGYLREAARLCRKRGAMLVLDEVQCGMGRTGRFLASQYDGEVAADMVVLSKALSGGYVPVGAVLMRKSIYDKVYSSLDRAVVHSSTFGQGGLAMVAGLATLKLLDEADLMTNARQMGDRLGQKLTVLKARYPFIHDVRWRGLMVAIEFGPPKGVGLRTAWNTVHRMDKSLFPQAVTIPLLEDHHILSQVAGHHIDVIKLIPPLVINEGDVEWFVDAFDKVMQNLHRFPGPAWQALAKIGKNSLRGRTRSKNRRSLSPEP